MEIPVSGGNVDLTGYATEQYVKDYAQPKGDYALRSEIPSVPVKSVNGKTGAVSLTATDVKARPDSWMPTASDVGALPSSTVIPTVPTKVSAFTNDAGYLTQHQDISGKLDASALPTAINTALAQAKASGEFDGSVEFQTDETLTLENGILSVNTTNDMEQDNTLPITSAGVFATVGNIEALLKTI